MSSEADRGQIALKANDYPAAINHLTNALKTTQSPLWLIQRSTAYQRTGQHELALADADNAVLAATSRARREMIGTAHFRRAIALNGLGQFGNARKCLLWCMKINDKEKGVTMWMSKVKAGYEKAGGDDAECNRVTVKEIPDKVEDVSLARKDEQKKDKQVEKKKDLKGGAVTSTALPVATPKEKIRTEWYQSTNTVTIEILAKGVPKDLAEISIREGELHVSFPIAGSSTYDYTLHPLCRRINVAESTSRITPHKIEIVLHKSEPGFKWPSLEGSEGIAAPGSDESHAITPNHEPKGNSNVVSSTKGPSYPTSSRNGPKDWDAIGKADGDDEDGDIDDFFKKLYKDVDPDSKRAMMKSYQESKGTSLSTSWKEVSQKTVPVLPPDGAEPKKW